MDNAKTGRAAFPRAFARSERGGVAILAALFLPLFIGGLGLGAETGYWHLKKQRLQHAADAAAHAAAVRIRAGGSQAETEANARAAAATSGHLPDRGGATVSSPPVTGAWRGWPGHVEVRLDETHPRLFSAVFAEGDVRFEARAVARVEGGAHACVLSLSPAGQGTLAVLDGGRADLTGCAAAANSIAPHAAVVGPHASMSALCSYVSGGTLADGILSLSCGLPRDRSHPVPDPYAVLPEPDAAGLPCRTTRLTVGSHTVLVPLDWRSGRPFMRLCGGLTVTDQLVLMPGVYVVEGDFEVSSGAHVYGSDVTVHLAAGARIRVSGSATASLSAPSGGSWAGLALSSSRASGRSVVHEFAGSSHFHLHGALYAPSTAVRIGPGAQLASSCAQVVADTVRVAGRLALGRSCGSSGMHEIVAGRQVAIVE